MCAEHGLEKSSESTTVKRKQGRPKKQTEASLGGRDGSSDMCDDLCRIWKSSDVERKRCRFGQILTLQDLLTEGVGWFTTKPAVTIVALGRRQ